MASQSTEKSPEKQEKEPLEDDSATVTGNSELVDDTYAGVRAEVARFLGPGAFPGDRDTIIGVAKENDATADVLRLLADLPEGETYRTTQEVVDAIPLNGAQPDG